MSVVAFAAVFVAVFFLVRPAVRRLFGIKKEDEA